MSVAVRVVHSQEMKQESPKKVKHKVGFFGHIKMALGFLTVGHIATGAVIGFYFFVTWQFNKHSWWNEHWDGLFSKYIPLFSKEHWSFYRHLIFREGAEGFYASNLWQQISFSPYKYLASMEGARPSWLDYQMMKLHIPNKWQKTCTDRNISGKQLSVSWLVEAIFGIPGAALGIGIVLALRQIHHLRSFGSVAAKHPGIVDKLYATNYDAKVVGFLAGFIFAKYVMRPVYFHVFNYFAERRVAKGKRAHFWHMPYYKMWVNDLRKDHRSDNVEWSAVDAQAARGVWVPRMMYLFILGLLVSSAFGYYVVAHYVK